RERRVSRSERSVAAAAAAPALRNNGSTLKAVPEVLCKISQLPRRLELRFDEPTDGSTLTRSYPGQASTTTRETITLRKQKRGEQAGGRTLDVIQPQAYGLGE